MHMHAAQKMPARAELNIMTISCRQEKDGGKKVERTLSSLDRCGGLKSHEGAKPSIGLASAKELGLAEIADV